MKKSEILSRITQCNYELAANDYARCKVAMEAIRLIKQVHPGVETPVYDHYAEMEAVAEQRRAEIRELEAQLPDAEDDTGN